MNERLKRCPSCNNWPTFKSIDRNMGYFICVNPACTIWTKTLPDDEATKEWNNKSDNRGEHE